MRKSKLGNPAETKVVASSAVDDENVAAATPLQQLLESAIGRHVAHQDCATTRYDLSIAVALTNA